jgi:hypothetical protein
MNILIYIIFLIFLILILILILLNCDNYIIENFPYQTGNALGNRFAEYFYYTWKNDKLGLFKNRILSRMTKNDELKTIYNKLINNDIKLIKNKKIIYDSYGDNSWHPNNKNYTLYIKNIRPYVNKVYKKIFDKMDIKYPVVHFRCSDIPMNQVGKRISYYHIPKLESILWISKKIKERNYKKIIFLTCDNHRSVKNNKKTCNNLSNSYINMFKNQNIDVKIQCESILYDFATMIYSPLLISLNASSFSLMAGISKNPNDYITTNMGVEVDGKYKLQKEGDWTIYPKEPYLHKNIKDYSSDKLLNKNISSY